MATIGNTDAPRIDAPADSGDFPIAVLLQGDDVGASECGECYTPASDWPRERGSIGGRPGVMFAADLYCANCAPLAYNGETGDRVRTLSGDSDARATAYEWHGGQSSALYSFASTGAIWDDAHRADTLHEVTADLTSGTPEAIEDAAALARLIQYVQLAPIAVRA